MAIDTFELHVKTLIEVGIAIEDARVTKKGGSNGAEEQQSQMVSLDYEVNTSIAYESYCYSDVRCLRESTTRSRKT